MDYNLKDDLVDCIAHEHAYIESAVSGLNNEDLNKQTPAEGFMIRDQLSHIAFFDDAAVLSAQDNARFDGLVKELEVLNDPMELHLQKGRTLDRDGLISWFNAANASLLSTYSSLELSIKLAWFGPSMSAASMLTARLMEKWAHGVDICETLNVAISVSRSLKHICYLGFRTREWSYFINNLKPAGDVYVVLSLPDSSTLEFGNPNSLNKIEGDALDFALVAVRRRYLQETNLIVEGDDAKTWMKIAQAFAGKPSKMRPISKDLKGNS